MARIPRSMSLSELDRILPHLVDTGLPGDGEFLVADLSDDNRTSAMIALLAWHGYLPMAGMGMLLGKIHKVRCILSPSEMHVGRKVRRRAKGFHLTVDQAWDVVVSKVQEFSYTKVKGDCWLSDEIAKAYHAVGTLSDPASRRGVRFHSVELWHTASGELVAGEIGFTCGSVYSSCTGFTMKDAHNGAGTVQMAAFGRWLDKRGFKIWDLGMEIEYKLALGGRLVPRSEWVNRIRSLRLDVVDLGQPRDEENDAVALISSAENPSAALSPSPPGRTDVDEREHPS
eukprot:TRINITY_DN45836_c0_g1_i1.p1 TRINITY_DN45836_c0_g1~~TRINITY_DN45836_c0_g1_i1.p1  ORF type:complete len:285 (-),score=25.99 TRINITY_DN45836_c0_g1_i1:208-1062(-)